jgi:hypothetical protein
MEMLTDHLRATIAEHSYAHISKIFDTTIKEIYADEAEIPVCLPPSLAVFLDIYKGPQSLEETLVKFRKTFEPVRKTFASLQQQFIAERSLGERRKIKRAVENYFKHLPMKYDADTGSSLQAVLSFAPEVIKFLANPHDPSKYSQDLFLKPAEWIREWWLRRPFRHIYRVLKKLEHIRDYEHLLSKNLNLTVNSKEKESFERYYKQYVRAYSKDS